MTKSKLLTLLVLAVIGYGVCFALYSRYSTAVHWNYQLDRAGAINRAHEAAQSFGVDTRGWTAQVKTSAQRDGLRAYYLRHQPLPLVANLLPLLQAEVVFRPVGKGDSAIVQLTPQGRVIRFCRKRCSSDIDLDTTGKPKRQDAPAANAPETLPNQTLAEATFKTLSGDEQARFAPTAQITRNGALAKFTWTATLPEDPRLNVLAEVSVNDKEVREATFIPSFSEAFQQEADADDNPVPGILKGAMSVLILVLGISGLFLFFLAWGDGELFHRTALRGAALGFALLLISSYFGGRMDDYNIDISIRSLAVLARALVLVINILLLTLPIYLFWAVGHSLVARARRRRTVAFELLLQGKLKAGYLWEQVTTGLLAGGIAAALPFVLKALPFFSAERFAVGDAYSQFTEPSAILSALTTDHLFGVFLFFSFAVPLLESYVPRATWAGAVIIFTGAIWLSGERHFPTSITASLLLGGGLAVLYYALYQRGDLLAVLAAALSSGFVLQMLALTVQPSPALHNTGWLGILLLSGVLIVGVLGVWRGSETPQAFFEPLLILHNRAERERLKADLEVASRAQQQMLPDAPPQLPGFDIAAICTPSKDVGGDLYDFIPLPDGRLGIVVADVSGKGVPAALYMTLTKGLLASVAEEQSDPGEILREVNRHLYEACRKKVFVTLFLGVLDPATRTLSYARAGHNPTVWRSPLRNATELLRPAGMGLGLNQGKIFNASLKVATLQLEPNDALFFYSDGITEAMNVKQEEYGEERLMAAAQQTDKLTASAALTAIMDDVKNFLGSIAPQDDQTLVVLKVG